MFIKWILTQNINNVWFELFGFDILLDHKLKPWVLEVNIGPSLSSSSIFDKRLKTRLIWDTLTLVGVRPYDKYSHKSKGAVFDKPPKLTQKSESEKIPSSYTKLNSKSPKKMTKIVLGTGISGFESGGDEDQDMINEMIEQEERSGNYYRIFPLKSNIDYYSQFFDQEKYWIQLFKTHFG